MIARFFDHLAGELVGSFDPVGLGCNNIGGERRRSVSDLAVFLCERALDKAHTVVLAGHAIIKVLGGEGRRTPRRYSRLTLTFFVWVYSWIASVPCSRPWPLCLKPPKGVWGWVTGNSLMLTMP